LYCWRITKYNPVFRDASGSYLQEEWTSVADIGRIVNGVRVTSDCYLDVENKYLDIITFAMEERGIEHLKVSGLELRDHKENLSFSDQQIEKMYNRLEEGLCASINEVSLLGKIVLRELAWARLVNKDFFVHFGYDYYMYLGCARKLENTKRRAVERGLFVEDAESPY
jgi:hypothetical protein